jgi:hypothetical protein
VCVSKPLKRIIRAELDEMEPVVAESANLRRAHPEIGGALDLYKSQLSELMMTIQRVQMTLLTRRAQMDASRAQLEAVSQWAQALGRTR